MIHSIIVQPSETDRYKAKWLTEHVSNGLEGHGEDAMSAVRDLLDKIEASEVRRAGLPD